MTSQMRALAQQAIDIYAKYSEASSYDAGFDAGEFSGPASARAADNEVDRLATDNGVTYSDLQNAINQLCQEEADEFSANEGPYGRNV